MQIAHLQASLTLVWLATLGAWVFVQRDAPALALAGAGAIALAHAWVLGLEFLAQRGLSRGDDVPRASARQLWRAWAAEVLTAPRVFCWQQPFRSRRFPDALQPHHCGVRGVVLVHGYLCNRGLWNPWMEVLARQGSPFMALNLAPVFGRIDTSVPTIEAAVARMTEVTGLAPLLVGHSMGGMAIRAWLAHTGAPHRVHRIVTLASPHGGAWLAHWGYSANARQLRPGSTWLQALDSQTRQAWRRHFVCFYSNADNVVFPPSLARLEGADNRLLPGLAHVQLLFQPALMAAVLALRDASAVPPPTAS